MSGNSVEPGELKRAQPQNVEKLGGEAIETAGDQWGQPGIERRLLPKDAGSHLMREPPIGLAQRLQGRPQCGIEWPPLSYFA
jgi:hypothetical protein